MNAQDDILLEVTDLEIAVDGTPIVHGVSFTVARGQVVALVGESGAGKSMTAMAVPALLPPGISRAGSIRFDGVELIGATEAEMRRRRRESIASDIRLRVPGADDRAEPAPHRRRLPVRGHRRA